MKIDHNHITVTKDGSQYTAACLFRHADRDNHDCKLGFETQRDAAIVGWQEKAATADEAVAKLEKNLPAGCAVEVVAPPAKFGPSYADIQAEASNDAA